MNKKKNFIINSIYTNNIFFKHEVPRFTSARTGFFCFTSLKAMARFTSARTGFLFSSAAGGSGTSKKKNFIINSIYTNNIFSSTECQGSRP